MKYIKILFIEIWKKIFNKYERENYTNGVFDSKKSWYYSRLDHKKRNIIGLIAIFIVIFLGIIDNLFINKYWLKSEILDREYKNNHKYSNVRQVEYVGGEILVDSNIEIERWCPLYIDKNTKEILRVVNTENYITAGGCKIGLDKVDILDERNTKSGFQKYILNWIGAIEWKEFSIDMDNTNFGISQATQEFNKPIDIIADKNWNINEEYQGNKKYLISTISEVKNYSINDEILEASGKLTENEYIFNILRNCFGYISDDFYNVENGKNKFSKKYIHEVEIGDIGTFLDKDGKECMGICIGFDKKNNPIFTICTSNKKIKNNDLKKFARYKNNIIGNQKDNNYGFNVLIIEKKHIIPIFQRHIFTNYYHTNLPFKKEDSNNILKKYIIDEISEYNNQIYYKPYSKNGCWKGRDLSYRLYNERIKRIKQREKKAEEIRNNFNINLSIFKNKNINEFKNIYDVKTIKYKENYENYTNEEKERYIPSDEQMEKIKQEEYEKGKEKFRERVMSKKSEIKGKTFEEAKKIIENGNSILTEVGEEILRECLKIINN